jgi:hypothetical protein
MQNGQKAKVRFSAFRFTMWALLMFSAWLFTLEFAPQRMVLALCVSLLLWGPMVMTPFKRQP